MSVKELIEDEIHVAGVKEEMEKLKKEYEDFLAESSKKIES